MQRDRKNQAMQVLKYMEHFGSITPLEAFEDLQIMRLSARIKDLKDLGYPIVKVTEHYSNNGIYKHYARYSLKK